MEEESNGPTVHDALRALLAEWASPPAEMVDTLPKGGKDLKYLSHGNVTRALIESDPGWEWEPMGIDAAGQPVMVRDDQGRPVGMWIYLTVHGVRRPGYGSIEYREVRGDTQPSEMNAVKSIISDCLKVTAMRFGVALNLWGTEHPETAGKPAPRRAPAPSPGDVLTKELAAQEYGKAAYDALVGVHGKDVVSGAMASHGWDKYSHLTAETVPVLERSLTLRANAESHNEAAAAFDVGDVPF